MLYFSRFCMIVSANKDFYLKERNHFIFVMEKCVLFEVRTAFLNIV
jgi:hypothetical protein